MADKDKAKKAQEAQAKHEPIEASIEAAYWSFDARRKGYGPWKETPMSERDAFKTEIRNAIFAQQHHPEQHLEMVAPADVPLPGHPEPHTYRWSALELEAIKQHREAYAKAAVAAERERCISDVEALHGAQSVNNQNHSGDWHEGVDAAIEMLLDQKGTT